MGEAVSSLPGGQERGEGDKGYAMPEAPPPFRELAGNQMPLWWKPKDNRASGSVQLHRGSKKVKTKVHG